MFTGNFAAPYSNFERIGTVHYNGDWVKGVPHGKGIMTWPNGDSIEGNFVNGPVNGQAV